MIRCISLAAIFLFALNQQTSGEDRTAYFGLLHAHTHFSDGRGTPDEAYTAAKQAGLDFFGITEHNHSQAAGHDGIYLTPQRYLTLKTSANEHTQPGVFVAIHGQEVSTISKGNHVNVFFADEICDMPNGNFRYLYEQWLPEHQETSIVQMNHPNVVGDLASNKNDYGYDDYDHDFKKLVAASDRYLTLIEVVKGSAHSSATNSVHQNGRYEKDYLFYLNQGYHIAPSAGEDNHRKTWGRSMHGRMGVWATELTRGGLEEAIVNHHCFASEDDSAVVQFTIDGHIMGSKVVRDGADAVSLKVTFSDSNEPEARYRVIILHDDSTGGAPAQVIENEVFDPGVNVAEFTHTASPGGYYVAKVVQISDHADDIWTAPIWIKSPSDAAAGTVAAANTDDPPQDEIEWSDAADYVGENITVHGKVIRAHNHEGKILFFNFHPNFSETLSLVLFKSDFAEFGGANALIEKLVNKRVTIRGRISLYRNERMQIVLKNASQIRAVE